MHPLNNMELRFAVQTYYDNQNLYFFHLQEGRELMALRFYRRTLEINFFILSYFADSRLQDNARVRIPSLYNYLTVDDLQSIVMTRIQFFRVRSEEPHNVNTGFHLQELLSWELFLDAIFYTESYVRPISRKFTDTFAVIRAPQPKDDEDPDDSKGNTALPRRQPSIFRGAMSPTTSKSTTQTRTPTKSAKSGTRKASTVKRTSQLFGQGTCV